MDLQSPDGGVRVIETKEESEEPVIEPQTPERKNGDASADSGSPLTAAKDSSFVSCCSDSIIGGIIDPPAPADPESPKTPKDSVFNAFVPGPDDMANAPLRSKHAARLITSAARHLDFDTCEKDEGRKDNVEPTSDVMILESLSFSLLEFIIWNQLPELDVPWGSTDSKTPDFPERLTGILETCPGAPRKAAGNPRDIDQRLCKRLF